MTNTTTLTPGTTVRITRTQPGGRLKFIKTGTVGPVVRDDYFEFTENLDSPHPGKHVYATSDHAVAAHMPGWTQHTEVLPS